MRRITKLSLALIGFSMGDIAKLQAISGLEDRIEKQKFSLQDAILYFRYTSDAIERLKRLVDVKSKKEVDDMVKGFNSNIELLKKALPEVTLNHLEGEYGNTAKSYGWDAAQRKMGGGIEKLMEHEIFGKPIKKGFENFKKKYKK